uniref:Uncharacterized protein n=1 Tax=Candidatus Kentrum sp. FM TaxID=2126340 RepID=A0A450S1C8_9GAMM|nr:MAG: hypothetical protein BECKFM1743A_GA0114220_100244 [Candidatus Kentron sp. FM]
MDIFEHIIPKSLDFIGNAPVGFADQPDAALRWIPDNDSSQTELCIAIQ